jgi:pimeloyl-ACP methyl ester carboxylesterase
VSAEDRYLCGTMRDMSATAASLDESSLEPYFYDVVSADGTRLEAWTNDPDCLIDGPTVLLCNGLGTAPWAWPALLRGDCGVRVISWNHRGVGGSERPRDPRRVGIAEFVEDAVAVMDAAGVARVPAIGWSMGVNTAFELAVRHPARVSGIFAVAGVPGGTFGTMLAPLHLPRPLGELVTVNVSRLMKLAGPLLTPVTSRLPITPLASTVVSHSGFMLPVADAEATAKALKAFLQIPVDWYFHMALRTHRHARVSLSAIDVPCCFVAGRWDILAGSRDMYTAAERMADSTYVELPATHFVQMEHPAQVHEELLAFLERL